MRYLVKFLLILEVKCCRGLVHALSFGDTFVLGIISGVYSEKRARTFGDPSSPSDGHAPMLVGRLRKPVTSLTLNLQVFAIRRFFTAIVSLDLAEISFSFPEYYSLV